VKTSVKAILLDMVFSGGLARRLTDLNWLYCGNFLRDMPDLLQFHQQLICKKAHKIIRLNP
jgi:hypothetical protein